jgi:electron transport complex protein RnfB
MHEQLVQHINDLLPQTQCTQCGFNGCLPYATALAKQETEINRCPPGGESTIKALAQLLNQTIKPLDPTCGVTTERHIASIDPQHCIGCTLCIKACPVDAIAGSSKRRHVVIAELCTGCELCVPPCPVDCIDMIFIPEFSTWNTTQAHAARARMNSREFRLKRQKEEIAHRLEAKAIHKLDEFNHLTSPDSTSKKAVIQAALERARARRKTQTS